MSNDAHLPLKGPRAKTAAEGPLMICVDFVESLARKIDSTPPGPDLHPQHRPDDDDGALAILSRSHEH